jgi:tetratricopeptide (TPR) repeat protein
MNFRCLFILVALEIQATQCNLERISTAITLLDQQRWGEAVITARQALDIDPNNAAAYATLGNALFSQGLFADAETAYRNALAIDPTGAVTLNNLSYVYQALGDYERAVDYYEQALRLPPIIAWPKRTWPPLASCSPSNQSRGMSVGATFSDRKPAAIQRARDSLPVKSRIWANSITHWAPDRVDVHPSLRSALAEPKGRIRMNKTCSSI